MAIAVEAVVKLVALIAVGLFVMFQVAGGPGPMLAMIEASPISAWQLEADRWIALTFVSAAAFICLPRMFHVLVVENTDERHLMTAAWAFPLYLFLISLFVVPIAVVGLSIMPPGSNPDTFVLTVPLAVRARGAGDALLPRRLLGRDLDGHRRLHRALHDGVEPHRHADLAPHPPEPRRRPGRRPQHRPPVAPPDHRRDPRARLCLLRPLRRGRGARRHRAHRLRGRGADPARARGRAVLARRHPDRRGHRPRHRLDHLGLHLLPAELRHRRAPHRLDRSPTVPSA
jgi:hypothetical protein